MSDNYNDRDHLSSGSTSSDIFGSNSSDKTENSFDYRSSNSEAQFDSGSSYAFTSENTSKSSKRKVNIILRSAVAVLAVAVLCACGIKVYKFLSVTKDELVAEYSLSRSHNIIDNNYSFVICKSLADKHSALTVVFSLFSVKTVGNINAKLIAEGNNS